VFSRYVLSFFSPDYADIASMDQVVREQCWLNGLLESVTWNAEGFDVMGRGLGEREDNIKVAEPTEEELEAILTGPFPTPSFCLILSKSTFQDQPPLKHSLSTSSSPPPPPLWC
jgi:hypothetical protein